MAGRFIRTKRKVISLTTACIICSQLMGCAVATEQEFLNMMKAVGSMEIAIEGEEIVERDGTEQEFIWIPLYELETYGEFRDTFESQLGVIQKNNTKIGCMYIDSEGKQEGNNTLYNAFLNDAFRKEYWNNEKMQNQLQEAIANELVDVEVNTVESQTAAINAYFNILPDAEPHYYNGKSYLSRGEFMSAIYRAETPVQDLASDSKFVSLVGSNAYTDYAKALEADSYLDSASKSLNEETFNQIMTRGEAIYMLVNHYYSEEFKQAEITSESISDIKNGGNIAGKYKFKEEHDKIYELAQAVQNPDEGAPEEIYKAVIVAYDKGILDSDEETRWDEGITKAESLELITKVYMSIPVIHNIANNIEESEKEDIIELDNLDNKQEAQVKEEESVYSEVLVEEAVKEEEKGEEQTEEQGTNTTESNSNEIMSKEAAAELLGITLDPEGSNDHLYQGEDGSHIGESGGIGAHAAQ